MIKKIKTGFIIGLTILLCVVVCYGAIITARLVVVKNSINNYNQTLESMENELIKKEEILEKQNEYLKKLENAKSLRDYIALWNELQD